MKGIITVKILLSITTVLGIIMHMLSAGLVFLGKMNPDVKKKEREGATLMRMQRAAIVSSGIVYMS